MGLKLSTGSVQKPHLTYLNRTHLQAHLFPSPSQRVSILYTMPLGQIALSGKFRGVKDVGLYWDCIGIILGLYWGYIRIMEKKMEATIVF